ncbi:MAG: EAL domain-containing protein [Acidimicrobiales bacterium]
MTVTSAFLGPVPPEESGGGAIRVMVVLLALFPYCLFRFTTSFRPVDSSSRLVTGTALAVVTATFLVPGVSVPVGTRPAWYIAYTALFVGYWTVVTVLCARRLWVAGQGEPTLARRRMRTLALAAVTLNLALFLVAGSANTNDGGGDLVPRVTGLAAAALFLIGFAPPPALRGRWRRGEVEALRAAEADLMGADTAQRVASILLPHAAALVGARSAVLVDGKGEVRAAFGLSPSAARALAGRLPSRTSPGSSAGSVNAEATVARPELVAVPVRSGWMAVATTTSTPLPGEDEFALLKSLAHLAGLALDRAELYDRERESRRALSERESQLAEAQRTAQLGSYIWDLRTGEVQWSDEMYRLLGLTPDDVADRGAAFTSRIHPDDRDAVQAAWKSVRHAAAPSMIEYRVVLPGGTIRWVQGRVHPVLGADGFPVRLNGTIQDITMRRMAEEAVQHQATHDTLTQLPNRTLFLERLRHTLARHGGRPTTVAVLLIDLDRFTWVNDSLGHTAGDELLVAAGARLHSVLGTDETLARFGGDEFTVLCETESIADAEALADRLRSTLAIPFRIGGEETAVTASIGIAYFTGPTPGQSPETLVRDADAALYRAKERGRDRYEVFDTTTRLITLARHDTVNAMRRGMDRNEFVVHYQPELDIRTNRVVAAEALVRWQHPQRGLTAPGDFIPLAEETGLIVPLGTEVLRTACQQAMVWRRENRALAVGVSVNLAARQLMAPDLSDVVERALEESGLDPSELVLEITESVLLDDAEASAAAIRRLKGIGVRIAVDDFGTGFSALTYLKRFPLDILKIDKSFVEGLGRAKEDRAIVAGLVDLAHAFGLTTVAEGVETPEQLDELHALGCEQGQGFLWSRPQPARALLAWMVGHAADIDTRPTPPVAMAHRAGLPRRRILIVDDDRSIRYLLRLVFEADDNYEVVGEAADGREAIALARHLRPNLILLDLAMPGMGGLEALPLIEAVVPEAKVVVLTGLEQPTVADIARRRGAAGFLVKDNDPLELPGVLETLLGAPEPA